MGAINNPPNDGNNPVNKGSKMTTIQTIFTEEKKYLNCDITIMGWVKTCRISGGIAFLEINDGSCFKRLQAVAEADTPVFSEISSCSTGAAVSISGKLRPSPGKGQTNELQIEKFSIVGSSSPTFPLQKKRHSFEYLREIAHLRPRTNAFLAVFRLRSIISQAIHRFFHEKGFVYVHTPIITGSDCEGAGEMFRVTTLPQNEIGYENDFFGKETNLTVSGQLEVESFCMAFSNVYTFGPTFRAENSNTPRHAAEFWMVEPEIAFAGIDEDMDLAEEMLKYLIHAVMNEAKEELTFFNTYIDKELIKRLENVINADFERITYSEAITILQESGKKFEYKPQWGADLQTEHERFLTEDHFKKPVFVCNYPKEIKAFYMRLNDDKKTVAAMDLLVPGVGEIIGGSQREERLDLLEQRLEEDGLHKDDYWWYLDLRKYGGCPHAGFGLGLERAVMYLSGIKNIRDVIPFPRTPGHAEF